MSAVVGTIKFGLFIVFCIDKHRAMDLVFFSNIPTSRKSSLQGMNSFGLLGNHLIVYKPKWANADWTGANGDILEIEQHAVNVACILNPCYVCSIDAN